MERVSKEIKVLIAKDLVSSYVRGEGGKNVNPDQLGELFAKVYKSVEGALPDPEERKIGLGI